MRTLLTTVLVCFGTVFGMLQAQTDEAYLSKFMGAVHLEWQQAAGMSAPSQPMGWQSKKVHGFMGNDASVRQQAPLEHPWHFYTVDAEGKLGTAEPITFPHHFNEERDYTKGWYVTNYNLDNHDGKRMVLMLNRLDLLSVVFVNGKRFGHHLGSYTPFEFDITEVSTAGQNTLAIFVHDRTAAVDGDKAYNQLGPEWLKSPYSQGREDKILKGGIDDAPILEMREPTHLKDVFVKTSTRKKELEIAYELTSHSALEDGATLSFEVYKWPKGEKVALEIPNETVDKPVGSIRVPWFDPELWSPNSPNLYVLRTQVQNGSQKDVLETRFGFREFWIAGKMFMLNGVPTRLRGESTFRTHGSDIESHKQRFLLYKELFGSNSSRIHAFMPHGDIIKAADEAGVLLINQSAIWSVNVMFYKNGGDRFLKNTEKEFEEWAKRDRNSPSVVIWDVENEMLRYNYELHLPWVSKLPGFIKKYDDTRPFNFSGGGWFSEKQDMASLHMQEHYTHITKDWQKKGTYPLLMGEFWVGGRMEQRLPTSPELRSVEQRYLEEAKIYQERLLEMRYLGVTGIMPFRISLLSFDREQSPESPSYHRPAHITRKIKHALQPESVFFWPRQNYLPANDSLQKKLVVCNDSDSINVYEVSWKWEGQPEKKKIITLHPAEKQLVAIGEVAPGNATKLIAQLKRNTITISADTLSIHPLSLPTRKINKTVLVYQDKNLAQTLISLGIKARTIDKVPETVGQGLLLIPEQANNRELNAQKAALLAFLEKGGNILCLKQSEAPLWFPVTFQFWSAYQTSPHTYEKMGWEGLHKKLFYSKTAPILAPDHPVFSGDRNTSLHLWDDYDGRVSDDVFVRPANVGNYEQGNWRPLASGTRREHVSLAELFYGKGTLLTCQLNMLDNLDNVQARNLMLNMLDYLAKKQPHQFSEKSAVVGAMSPKDLASSIGTSVATFLGTKAVDGQLMLAFEGSPISKIKEWATKGGTVLVLSDSVAEAFEGIETQKPPNASYQATKIQDHLLLQGVSSGSFINADTPIIDGYFSKIPAEATVLLQGFKGVNFWNIKEAGPVMFSIPHGAGEIIFSTLKISNDPSALSKEFLALLLTNAGVKIQSDIAKTTEVVTVKKTVPIEIDGVLNEWLEDMEDRFVTPYIHAEPIYLTSEHIVEGPPRFDLDLSAINYMLWDEKALHIAAVVFGEGKTYETGIEYGGAKEYVQEIKYNNDLIQITVKNRKAIVLVNGKAISEDLVKIAAMNSSELTDATKLQFNHILASGKIARVENLTGETLELKIPWELLLSRPSDTEPKALISIASKGSKLQVPQPALSISKETWLQLKLNAKGK